MPLAKTLVPVVLGSKLDTKTDPKQLQAGLTVCENGFMERRGELRKRFGFEQISSQVVSNDEGVTTLPPGKRLAKFNDELVLLTEDYVFGYASKIDRWILKGPLSSVQVSSRQVIANSYEQTTADMAYAGGVSVFAYRDTRGGVRASAIDEASGSFLVRDVLLNSTGARSRVIACGQYLFVFYFDTTGNVLRARRLDSQSPSAFSSEATVATNVDTTISVFDVCVVGARMIVTFRTTGNQLRVLYFLQTNAVGGVLDGVPDPTDIADLTGVAVEVISIVRGLDVGGTPTIHIVFASSTRVYHIARYADFSSYKLLTDTLDSAGDRWNIGAVVYDTSVEIYVENGGSSDFPDHEISRLIFDITLNLFDSADVFLLDACMISRPFRTEGSTHIVIGYASRDTFQDTFFVLDGDRRVEGKIYPGVAGVASSLSNCASGVWPLDDASEWGMALLKRTRVATTNANNATIRSVAQGNLNFGEAAVGLPVQLGGNLHIPGGFLKAYDGFSVVEHGFHLYPETAAPTFDTTGSVGEGTYQYVSVWAWVDAQGQIHRSAPSIPRSVTVTAPNDAVTTRTYPLRFTEKIEPQRTPIFLEVYRTKAGGRIFYKVTDDTNPVFNDRTLTYLEWEDVLSDAQIDTRPILYTTGDVLENISAKSCNVAAVVKNRLFLGGLESGSEYQFSKEFLTGEGVAFSDTFVRTLSSAGGDITAVAEMDDKVVYFKRSSIFWFAGDGPLDTGAQDSFSLPAAASLDVGCIEPASVVEMPLGLMFKSEKGIYLLTRGLELVYVGAEVEAFNGLTIMGAVTVSALNQVRFVTQEGRALVYDYYYSQWYTFTNTAAMSTARVGADFYLLRADGSVWKETDAFADVGLPVPTTLETGWISMAGLLGFKRLYRILFVGEMKGRHMLQVRVAYDFQGGWEDEYLIDPGEAMGGIPYGDGPYGDGVYGSLGNYLFDVEPSRQECSSVKIQVRDYYPDTVPSEGFRISAMSFEIGVREGGALLAAARRMQG